MCGIAGIIRENSTVDMAELTAMNNTQIHRGPDGEGFFVHENVGFAHRRLSIIDIATGSQPMSTADEKLWITYNGELYNFNELKQELQQKGYSFRTQSDTEVILYSYKEWGTKCLDKFRGMFAFAIFDKEKQEVFLARDPFGIKPLVYRISENYFAFSSEINALKKTHDKALKGNLKALDLYLTLQYIPAPYTIYQGIFKLPPATFLRVNLQGEIIEKKTYYDLHFNSRKGLTHSDWLEMTDHALSSSVKVHLMSDVPFGVFLSGGIDSTLIALKMSKMLNKPLKAFTIGFEEPSYNELKFAETAAKKLKVELISETISENALEILPNLINNHYGEPFGDSSAIPTWYVSRLARKEVSMVLTGDGGDEMFGGYHSYQYWLNNIPREIVHRKLALKQHIGIPRFILGTMKNYAKNNFSFNHLHEWIDLMAYTKSDLRKALWKEEFHNNILSSIEAFDVAHKKAQHFDRLSYAQYIDIHTYLPYDILAKVDIASMANSLETRPPFIDREVAKISQQLPMNEKRSLVGDEMQTKFVLKELMLTHFPSEFVFRKKQGFAIPFEKWFLGNNDHHHYFKQALTKETSPLRDYFNMDGISVLYEKFNNSKGSFHYFAPLWLLFILSIWLEANPGIEFEN